MIIGNTMIGIKFQKGIYFNYKHVRYTTAIHVPFLKIFWTKIVG